MNPLDTKSYYLKKCIVKRCPNTELVGKEALVIGVLDDRSVLCKFNIEFFGAHSGGIFPLLLGTKSDKKDSYYMYAKNLEILKEDLIPFNERNSNFLFNIDDI